MGKTGHGCLTSKESEPFPKKDGKTKTAESTGCNWLLGGVLLRFGYDLRGEQRKGGPRDEFGRSDLLRDGESQK